jgi:hypothetical protein
VAEGVLARHVLLGGGSRSGGGPAFRGGPFHPIAIIYYVTILYYTVSHALAGLRRRSAVIYSLRTAGSVRASGRRESLSIRRGPELERKRGRETRRWRMGEARPADDLVTMYEER